MRHFLDESKASKRYNHKWECNICFKTYTLKNVFFFQTCPLLRRTGRWRKCFLLNLEMAESSWKKQKKMLLTGVWITKWMKLRESLPKSDDIWRQINTFYGWEKTGIGRGAVLIWEVSCIWRMPDRHWAKKGLFEAWGPHCEALTAQQAFWKG